MALHMQDHACRVLSGAQQCELETDGVRPQLKCHRYVAALVHCSAFAKGLRWIDCVPYQNSLCSTGG